MLVKYGDRVKGIYCVLRGSYSVLMNKLYHFLLDNFKIIFRSIMKIKLNLKIII
jgi:hypothetical protein